MPMPKPYSEEEQKDFIARFMSDKEMIKDYPDEKQRAAIAYKTWRGNENADTDQLEKGEQVESEHAETVKKIKDSIKDGKVTLTDEEIFKLIAEDHLKELPDYYTKLEKIEKQNGDKKMDNDKKFKIGDRVRYVIGDQQGRGKITKYEAPYYTIIDEDTNQRIKSELKYLTEASNENRNNGKSFPKKYTCQFIEPGLISYENEGMGKVLILKDALDKMAPSFIGKPVVDLTHKDATPENFEKIADGVISDVYWKDEIGWYCCDFIVWDEETKKNIESGKFSVSCAYVPT
jgi:hypothetical protein